MQLKVFLMTGPPTGTSALYIEGNRNTRGFCTDKVEILWDSQIHLREIHYFGLYLLVSICACFPIYHGSATMLADKDDAVGCWISKVWVDNVGKSGDLERRSPGVRPAEDDPREAERAREGAGGRARERENVKRVQLAGKYSRGKLQ
ncbi:hypothetical protein MLD38_016077 [Melastoma candidum]|uniref:Uncharacterized protein n=1 Tax=Melastoma candidum TaxID=119954 RepID=A0ACB9RJE4_9MYRT|nr:hypothetical protein MLD38_016077 [Melastoma candidum]